MGGCSPPSATNPATPQPHALSEPWRGYAQSAQDAKRRFDQIVASVAAGPLRQRLATLSARLDDGVDESWRIAKRGHEIVAALGQIDTAGAAAELAELEAAGDAASAPQAATIESLRAQLAAAERLSTLATQSRDRLRLLDARFDELIARAVEVSVGSGDSEVLGHDVDQLVTELESLACRDGGDRQAVRPADADLAAHAVTPLPIRVFAAIGVPVSARSPRGTPAGNTPMA